MIDREKLAEALEVYPEMHGFPRYEFEECAVVAAAARAYLDGETVWWCLEHHNSECVSSTPEDLHCANFHLDDGFCRMVEAVLSAKAEVEDE